MGTQSTQIEQFEALLPYPKSRLLEMTAPRSFTAKLAGAEDCSKIATPPTKTRSPTYNAYSGDGDVTGQVVYVNYGIPEDYEQLKKLGIDVKGKIALARYGKSWRGTKAKVAQENGAVGCLIYSDPREDGYFQGDIYPKGAFRPPDGAQRGSVMDMPLYPGDPCHRAGPARKARASSPLQRPRLDEDPGAADLVCGCAAICWRTSKDLLRPNPGGAHFRVTYHIGPGPATARMKVDNRLDNQARYIT